MTGPADDLTAMTRGLDALVTTTATRSDAMPDNHDPVDHPAHYTSHPSGVECIQITEHMGFNLGNAIKYLWRADEKGSALEDLRKAAWYVEREIARRGVAAPAPTTCPHGRRGACLTIRCGSNCSDAFDRMHPCTECAAAAEQCDGSCGDPEPHGLHHEPLA